MLQGAAAAAPLVVTLRGGQAWAVSSCSTSLNSAEISGYRHGERTDLDTDSSRRLFRRRPRDVGTKTLSGDPFADVGPTGLNGSCGQSSGGSASVRIENLTKTLV